MEPLDKPPRFRIQKVKTKYSDQFKANVIMQRFGSLSKTDRVLVSRGYLVKKFNVRLSTIQVWCRKHKKNPGCLWDKYRYKGSKPRKFSQQ